MLLPEQVSINTATLGYQQPIEQTIEAIARHGFGAIAPWRREVEVVDVERVARRIRDAGLDVSGYCRSSYLSFATPGQRETSLAENRRAIRDAAILGAPCFVLVVGGLVGGTRDIEVSRSLVIEGIASLMEDARQAGIALAIEPLHPMYAADRSCVNTIDQALDICQQLDADNSGLLTVAVDVYHVWWDPKLHPSIARAGEQRRLGAFHVCDWLVPTNDLLMDRGMMGEGTIDIPAIRRSVETAGYEGYVEVEIFSSRWWKQEPDRILDAVCNSIKHC